MSDRNFWLKRASLHSILLVFCCSLTIGCSNLQVDTKGADCQALFDAYQEIKDVQPDPLEANKVSESDKFSIAEDIDKWLTNKKELRTQQGKQVSEQFSTLELQDEGTIQIQQRFLDNVEEMKSEQFAFLEIVAEISKANLTARDPMDFLDATIGLNIEKQSVAVAATKRKRADNVRSLNQYCNFDIPLPFKNQ